MDIYHLRTLISRGGFQFAHLDEALKIKSMNIRELEWLFSIENDRRGRESERSL